MDTITPTTVLAFDELDRLDAPSWESFYQGVLAGLGVIGIIAAAT